MESIRAMRLAYLAGYFDGEGCIWMSGVHLIMRVVSGDKESIEELASVFNGSVKDQKRYDGRPAKLYRWEECGLRAQACITELLPYLKAKREVAELALRFIATRQGNRMEYQGRLDRIAIREQISRINRAS